MAKEFPNAFKGYTMTVKEAHQSSKVDTSGTAKAVVSSFQKLGLDFEIGQIDKVRDRAGQLGMGVPGAPARLRECMRGNSIPARRREMCGGAERADVARPQRSISQATPTTHTTSPLRMAW